mmetsp:Transcript_42748/g.68622  ORF Transcript_42748/g.68622 Transcript_42748/m.68622 type:complete len:106 (-) Transcript_42748:103-420(-)
MTGESMTGSPASKLGIGEAEGDEVAIPEAPPEYLEGCDVGLVVGDFVNDPDAVDAMVYIAAVNGEADGWEVAEVAEVVGGLLGVAEGEEDGESVYAVAQISRLSK